MINNQEFKLDFKQLLNDEMNSAKEKTDFLISMAQEEGYRRGYAHGFSFGIKAERNHSKTMDEIKEIKQQIEVWRHDPDMLTGAPGSPYDKVPMSWKGFEETEEEKKEKRKNMFEFCQKHGIENALYRELEKEEKTN